MGGPVVNAVLVTLDNMQLTARYVELILEDKSLRLNYIDQGLFVMMR